MPDQVLVVTTDHFRECGDFQGFTDAVDTYSSLFDETHQWFIDREKAEADPEHKQLIPYVMIERGGRLAAYYRGKGQGEKRLHGKRSVGVGGHINPVDAGGSRVWEVADPAEFLGDRYLTAVVRELCEELTFEGMPEGGLHLPVVGLLNDDSTDVGKVHLGVVHKLVLPIRVDCTANEDSILDFAFSGKPVLFKEHRQYMYEQAAARVAGKEYTGPMFETWSQICLEHVLGYPAPSRHTTKLAGAG